MAFGFFYAILKSQPQFTQQNGVISGCASKMRAINAAWSIF